MAPTTPGTRRWTATAAAQPPPQAVPWLIGIILALAGMVIVLLALIFSSPTAWSQARMAASSRALRPNPPMGSAWWTRPPSRAAARRIAIGLGRADSRADTRAESDVRSAGDDVPRPPVRRCAGLLLLRDFSVAQDEDVVAQADQGVSSYANAPDGRVSAAVIDGRAVAIDPRGKTRRLADNIGP